MNEEMQWNVSNILGRDTCKTPYCIIVLNQPILSEPGLIRSLWKNANLRLTVDGGTNRWLKFIETNSAQDLPLPDCITGDFDSITQRTRDYFRGKLVEFVETPDQDATDFTKALKHAQLLMEKKKLQVNRILVLVTNSGRVDHIMANLETLHTSKRFLKSIPVILISSNSLTWLLPGGKNHTICVPEEFVSNQYSVGLIPLLGPTKVTTSGLKWDLDDGRLAFGELVSTSNTYNQNVIRCRSDRDLIWTVQYSTEDD
ncbi:UNVERIFIED_CONTAM: hypothetical protein PYX00_008353 [Menopon gallinae]|uniref:Thiamin pyrophosphokinase thiamin-binding domain-containing protein n=1 Tax=Menopon gallinae TaxID=328185 RepID=A0AAW2HMZ5_9NEOP